MKKLYALMFAAAIAGLSACRQDSAPEPVAAVPEEAVQDVPAAEVAEEDTNPAESEGAEEAPEAE